MDGHTVIVGRIPARGLPTPSAEDAVVRPRVRSKRMRRSRAVGRVALNLVFVAMLASAAIMIGPAMLGFHRYVILTGSMTGTYDRGSIVYDRPVPVSELKVGDPITYSPPPGFTSQTRVTHRIWSIHRGADGARVFKTKGDANKHPDAWTFTLNVATQDRVVFHIPEVGYLFVLLSLRYFRIVLVGVPAAIIGLILLRRLWRESGEAVRRQKLAELGWRALPDPGSGAVLQPLDAPAADCLPAWVDLRLRPVRAGAVHGPARLHIATRSRVDLSRPLRVGKLGRTCVGGAPADARGSSIEHQQLAPGASLATIRLRVAHRRTPRRAPRAAPS
jgi:signal peptidase I